MKKFFAFIVAILAVGFATAQPPMGPPPGMGPRGPRKSPQERIAAIAEELKTLLDGYKDVEMDEKTALRMVMDQLNADADIIACKKEYMRVFKN